MHKSRQAAMLHTSLAILIAVIVGMGLLPSGALAQDCTPDNTPSIHAGDQVTVIATLFTSDPNENGEGNEFLTVQSTGGEVPQVVSTYNLPQSFTYTAVANGETLAGFINGDGDESCTLSVTTNSKRRLTDDQKKALNKTGIDLDIEAAGLGGVAAICLLAPDPTVTKICGVLAGVGGALTGISGLVLQRIALDPPDPNFTVIATPVIPTMPALINQTGATPQVVKAFNALTANEVNVFALSNVILTCINRAQGAANAGNAFWEANQVAAAQLYENQLGNFLSAEPNLRASLQNALQTSGFPTIDLVQADILNFEQAVAANGLPSDWVSTLQALGTSSDDIDQLTQVTIVQDTGAAAQSFPASLTDPTLTSDLQGTGHDFQPSGPCVANAMTLCLNNGRFAVSATFSAGALSGLAQVVQLTPDTGYMWFFSSSNVEAVIKVLNACSLNQAFWVYAGGLTDVNVVISVLDTKTGAVKTYNNPSTPFQPIEDTSAFNTCSAADTADSIKAPPGQDAGSVAKNFWQETASLVSALSAKSLQLNNNRFKIDVTWRTPQGTSGVGTPVQLTPDTGYFWFFSSSNVEMVIKVLNACTLNNRYWVFAGGLTDVKVDITVTDTKNGTVNHYSNPQSTAFQPIEDTNAFATCP